MGNGEIAGVLEQLGELLEIDGEQSFKVRAYFRAAEAIRSLHDSAEKLHAEDRLTCIPGVGKAINDKVGEILQTGTCSLLEKMKQKVPAGVVEMLRIPGLGPKKAGIFFHKLGITSVESLKQAAESRRLRELPGMGKKSEDNILEAIERLHQRPDRIGIGTVRPYGIAMVEQLRSVPGVEQISVAGSLRRWRETVKDLDIVASSTDAAALMAAFVTQPAVGRVVLQGDTKSTVVTALGIQADIRVVAPGQFAALLNHFTGSAAHNIRLRSLANARGLRINEYGVYRESDGSVLTLGDDERALYDLLGLQFVPPEMREDRGEIEAAAAGDLPRLVEMSDIKGDIHCHTHYSDGEATIAEMATAARDRGYSYLGITDHSGSLPIAHGLSVERIRQQIREIREWNETHADSAFRLFAGTECDILADGDLDWPAGVLNELDFVVASVHSRFKMDRETMTRRIVRAIETGRITVLGHPTGRLVSSRDPYEVDLQQVFKAALRTRTCVEIDGHPERLDLNDVNARSAKEMGLRLSVDSDAHSPEGLALIEYGVHCARRAWLTPDDVINTRTAEQLLKLFRRE